jgi:hypothetical protein
VVQAPSIGWVGCKEVRDGKLAARNWFLSLT